MKEAGLGKVDPARKRTASELPASQARSARATCRLQESKSKQDKEERPHSLRRTGRRRRQTVTQ